MGRRKRLLFYAPWFAEYSTRMVQALGRDADVLYVVNGDNCRTQCEEAWFKSATAGMRVIRFTVRKRPYRWFWTAVILVAGLLFRPDLVHIQEQPDWTSRLVTKVMRRLAPVVVTVHDPHPHSGTDAAYVEMRSRERAEIRDAASLFHVHGDYCKRELLKIDSTRPIVATFHGLIHCPGPDDLRSPEPGRILFFGRMETYKGLEVLMDAMDLLAARGRDYRLVLAGRGPERQRLAARMEGRADVILNDHYITIEEAVEELQRASLVVLPYLDATQSGVAAAAIANGRPIVASATGGLIDVVQDGKNGLLVPPGDGAALADALDRVLQDPALRRVLTDGAVASQQALSWERIAQALAGAYNSISETEWRPRLGAAT